MGKGGAGCRESLPLLKDKFSNIFKIILTVFLSDTDWKLFEFAKCCIHKKKSVVKKETALFVLNFD